MSGMQRKIADERKNSGFGDSFPVFSSAMALDLSLSATPMAISVETLTSSVEPFAVLVNRISAVASGI